MKVPKPRKLSSGNYFIQLRLGGESISVTATNEKECRRQAALIKAEYLAGVKRKKATGGNKTLHQAIDDYISARNNTLSPSTIRGYKAIQKYRFAKYMPKNILDLQGKWQEICNEEAEKCSARTLKNAYSLIKSVYKKNGVVLPEVTLPQVSRKKNAWLTQKEILKFIVAVSGEICEIPALLALHSLRRSEVFGLTWDNVDLERKLLIVKGAVVENEQNRFVHKDENKTVESSRVIPIMIPELLTALQNEPDKSGAVVKWNPKTIWNHINRVCEENKLPNVGFQGLRRSFASLAYRLGISERETMEIGGWSNIQTMHKIYTYIAQEDKLKAENKMARFFKNANKNANKKKKS